DHLEEDVAELVAERRRVAAVDGVQHLVGLLDEIRTEGRVRLLAVPRTTTRRPQPRHDVDETAEAREGLRVSHSRGLSASRRGVNAAGANARLPRRKARTNHHV